MSRRSSSCLSCSIQCTNGRWPSVVSWPGYAHFALFCGSVYCSEFYFHTRCVHFGLIPRGLCVCIRSGRTFPSLFLIGFLVFAGFFVSGNAYQYSRVRPTGDVAPQPPLFSSVSINEFLHKAFVWFVCTLVIS